MCVFLKCPSFAEENSCNMSSVDTMKLYTGLYGSQVYVIRRKSFKYRVKPKVHSQNKGHRMRQ
jgi:hypothetical protein